MAEQLTFDDIPEPAAGEKPLTREQRTLRLAADIMLDLRDELGYKDWHDAWAAFIGYKQDRDMRLTQGTANWTLLEAVCEEDPNPMDDESLLMHLAEVGALCVAEAMLKAFRLA